MNFGKKLFLFFKNNFKRNNPNKLIHNKSNLKPFLSYLPCIAHREYFSIIFNVKNCALYSIKHSTYYNISSLKFYKIDFNILTQKFWCQSLIVCLHFRPFFKNGPAYPRYQSMSSKPRATSLKLPSWRRHLNPFFLCHCSFREKASVLARVKHFSQVQSYRKWYFKKTANVKLNTIKCLQFN
jgi:hypothetical protein